MPKAGQKCPDYAPHEIRVDDQGVVCLRRSLEFQRDESIARIVVQEKCLDKTKAPEDPLVNVGEAGCKIRYKDIKILPRT